VDAPPIQKRLAAETIGTFGFFFLGFSGVAAATQIPDSISGIGIAAGFGFGLALMITAFGHISGGHYNPAVSVGLAVGGKFPMTEVGPYVVAQLVGGSIAALVARAIYTSAGDVPGGDLAKALVNHPGGATSSGSAVLAEVIATALFLLVISSVATDSNAPWNGVMAPWLIGLFIFTAANVVGPISGGSFNPARSIAPAIFAGEFTDLWIYIVGPIVGGAIGGAVFKWIRSDEA
jgi:aquaporin Z